jgi:hypothetical protein
MESSSQASGRRSKSMGSSGAAVFNDPFDYQASVVGASLALVLTAPGDCGPI